MPGLYKAPEQVIESLTAKEPLNNSDMSLRERVACCRKASFAGNGRRPWQERQRSGGARQARPSGPSGNRAACVTLSRQADACLQNRALSARLPEGQRHIRVIQRFPNTLPYAFHEQSMVNSIKVA